MARRRSEPTPLGGGSAAAKIAFYRAHGDTPPVLALEAVLTADWRSTQQLADAAECSYNFARGALEYLAVEGRAERSHEPRRNGRGDRSFRYLWRLPADATADNTAGL